MKRTRPDGPVIQGGEAPAGVRPGVAGADVDCGFTVERTVNLAFRVEQRVRPPLPCPFFLQFCGFDEPRLALGKPAVALMFRQRWDVLDLDLAGPRRVHKGLCVDIDHVSLLLLRPQLTEYINNATHALL